MRTARVSSDGCPCSFCRHVCTAGCELLEHTLCITISGDVLQLHQELRCAIQGSVFHLELMSFFCTAQLQLDESLRQEGSLTVKSTRMKRQ